jgi:hypothetical protein
MAMASTVITQMIEKNELVREGSRFRCFCGSILKEKSVKGHLSTKKHKTALEKSDCILIKQDCDICMETQMQFKSCDQCRHSICTTCSSKVTKCPFCRFEYNRLGFVEFLKQVHELLIDERDESMIELFDFLVKHKYMVTNRHLTKFFENVQETLRTYFINDNWNGALYYYRNIFDDEMLDFYAVHY